MRAVGIKSKQTNCYDICPEKAENKRKMNQSAINTIPPPRGVGIVCDER